MSWKFEPKAECDLFTVYIAAPAEGQKFAFTGWGEPIPGHPKGWVKAREVAALISGSSWTHYVGMEPYYSEDFAHQIPGAQNYQEGPGGLFVSTPGPNMEYMCCTGKSMTPLDYEVFRGPHEFTTVEEETYILVVRGYVTINDVVFGRWKIGKKLGKGNLIAPSYFDGDCITFYIWRRPNAEAFPDISADSA